MAGPGVCGEGRYRADKLRSNTGARTYVRMHCMYEWYRDRRRAAQAGEKRRTINAFWGRWRRDRRWTWRIGRTAKHGRKVRRRGEGAARNWDDGKCPDMCDGVNIRSGRRARLSEWRRTERGEKSGWYTWVLTSIRISYSGAYSYSYPYLYLYSYNDTRRERDKWREGRERRGAAMTSGAADIRLEQEQPRDGGADWFRGVKRGHK